VKGKVGWKSEFVSKYKDVEVVLFTGDTPFKWSDAWNRAIVSLNNSALLQVVCLFVCLFCVFESFCRQWQEIASVVKLYSRDFSGQKSEWLWTCNELTRIGNFLSKVIFCSV